MSKDLKQRTIVSIVTVFTLVCVGVAYWLVSRQWYSAALALTIVNCIGIWRGFKYEHVATQHRRALVRAELEKLTRNPELH
jgi:hypothetical protein